MQLSRATFAIALALPVMGGCATRGWVRQQMATQRTEINTAIAQEHSSRVAEDSSLRTDLAGVKSDIAATRADLTNLRGALDSMRTEFNAKIAVVENGIRFALPVHFAFNDANVRDTDHAGLERFAQIVQKYYPDAKVTVEGFADPAGSTRYNLNLSQRRAEAVRSYLEQQGLTAGRLGTVGYGESRLVTPGAWGDMSGADLNRRVCFVIETGGTTSNGVASATATTTAQR